MHPGGALKAPSTGARRCDATPGPSLDPRQAPKCPKMPRTLQDAPWRSGGCSQSPIVVPHAPACSLSSCAAVLSCCCSPARCRVLLITWSLRSCFPLGPARDCKPAAAQPSPSQPRITSSMRLSFMSVSTSPQHQRSAILRSLCSGCFVEFHPVPPRFKAIARLCPRQH